MSLKQKFISAITFVFAIVAFTTFVSAQDNSVNQPGSSAKQERREHKGFGEGRHGGFDKGMRGERGDRMMGGLNKLNLTDAQKTQIKALMDSNRTANQSTFEQMRGLMMKKRDGSITAEEQTQLDSLRAQLKASAEQTHNSVLAILTPEQRAQLEQLKAERKQKMQERRQMRQNNKSQTDQPDND